MEALLLILALVKQIVVGIGCFVLLRIRHWPDTLTQKFPIDRPTKGLILFLWFVMGTWLRYKTNMPVLGLWGHYFGMKW